MRTSTTSSPHMTATVKKLFGECVAQQHLQTEQLETGMDLLGCLQQAPTTPAPQPEPGRHEEPQCHEDEARRCLNEAAMDLPTSFGFKQGDAMLEQPACTLPARGGPPGRLPTAS
ncbi:uncharacterized protein LOC144101186 [Amblyomma americanum]